MRTRTIALAAVLLATLTACSSSDDGKASSKTNRNKPATAPKQKPTSEDAGDLEKAVRAYSIAYFKPDAEAAYSALSARCREEISDLVFKPVVEAAAKDYGKQEIKTLTVDQLSGDLARVSYTYSVPKLDQKQQPWAREGGVWRYDAC
ncbi:hypothetical protein ACFVWX_13420 [Streptomyces sp. NPDC058220]|uniref:hypothetical protein n=1 Tax=Streptomyces sp. NPDC058220 TaxID=3346387 RepID=UPI0036E071B4